MCRDSGKPPGIHHVTAIATDPQRNLDFYAGVLGMRLVKRTVNFDDPTTYHFYFGDTEGTPGSLLTFFPQALKLPISLEPRRFEIEALLPNIRLPMELPGPNA